MAFGAPISYSMQNPGEVVLTSGAPTTRAKEPAPTADRFTQTEYGAPQTPIFTPGPGLDDEPPRIDYEPPLEEEPRRMPTWLKVGLALGALGVGVLIARRLG